MNDDQSSIKHLILKYLLYSILILVSFLVLAGILSAAYKHFINQQDWAAWTEFGDYSTTTTSQTTIKDTQNPLKITSISETTIVETHPGKTLWDLLDLFIVPITLALIAVIFNWRLNLTQQRIAQNNLWEAEYKNYLDEMRSLLLEKNLLDSREDSGERKLARAYTIKIFRNLDRGRKRVLLQFLNESELSVGESPIIPLAKVNLEKADLSNLDLNGINLSEALLTEANLSKALLARAILYRTVLKKANLRGTYLDHAMLTKADLENADLQGAIFSKAVLSGTILTRARLNDCFLNEANLEQATVSDDQLVCAKSLMNTIMPNGRVNQSDQLIVRQNING